MLVTAYSYFFGAMFMGLATIYYAVKDPSKFEIPYQVSTLLCITENTCQTSSPFFFFLSLCFFFPFSSPDFWKSVYVLIYAVFISSALCYLLITWANFHISSIIVTAFWPVQVRKEEV